MHNDEQLVFDLDMLETELKESGSASVQFDRPLQSKLRLISATAGGEGPLIEREEYTRRLRKMCSNWGDRLEVRFYGHHGEIFDAAQLLDWPEIRSLTINSMYDEARNMDALGEMPNLVKLQIGIFELEDKKLLEKLPVEKLTELILEETSTKALDLAPLANAGKLKTLKLYGHKKNIDFVGELAYLQEFVFNPAKNLSLDFLNGLHSLKALKFVLGGSESIEELTHLPCLQDIAFTMTRGLTELGDLQRFPKLRRLFMQDQPHVSEILTGARNTELQHLWFYNCPKLSELKGIEQLSSLNSLRLVMTAMKLKQLGLPPNLTHLNFSSAQAKKETQEKAAVEALGLIADDHPEMPFFYK